MQWLCKDQNYRGTHISVFEKNSENAFSQKKSLNKNTDGKWSSRAFQWMVMSGFNNLVFGQFLCPTLISLTGMRDFLLFSLQFGVMKMHYKIIRLQTFSDWTALMPERVKTPLRCVHTLWVASKNHWNDPLQHARFFEMNCNSVHLTLTGSMITNFTKSLLSFFAFLPS
jgi:hypothetical protein